MHCPNGIRIGVLLTPLLIASAAMAAEPTMRDLFRAQALVTEGYCRKEFEVPREPIWQAVAEVSLGSDLYVNGKPVPVPPNTGISKGSSNMTSGVDLAPYLQQGRNCVALHGSAQGQRPFLYLQGQVVSVSGAITRFDSDGTWRASPVAAEGWNRVGFDDGAWKPAETDDDFYGPLVALGENRQYIGPGLPAYDGRVVLENPGESKLYFDSAKPVAVRARVPEGLADRQPTLTWVLARAEEEGEQEVARGRADQFTRSQGSLVYALDPGQRERGVYTLQVTLSAGGEVLEERVREPLMVLGQIPMKEVAGDSYEEGMKLTLEDTVDFTDPNDPHPWVETTGESDERGAAVAVTTPNIVRRHGLVYRETARVEGNTRNPVFSYKIGFQHPGDLYVMVLEYPNDADRWIGISTSTSLDYVWTNSKAGAAVWTGDKYPLTNKMQELRWIFRSGPGPHTVDVLAMQTGSTAAAARLRIYHLEELTALKDVPAGLEASAAGAPVRRYGTYTERTEIGSGFGKTFGRTRPLPRLECPAAGYRPMAERLRHLRDVLDACEQYARYLRFTGQNLHAMGCHQYSDGNTPFVSPKALFGSRVPRDLRETAVRVFAHNGIGVIGVISFASGAQLSRSNRFSDEEVAEGADTTLLVSREGKQPTANYAPGCNFVHPKVEETMLSVAEDVAEKFREQPNFIGINWTPYLSGEWIPGYAPPRFSEPLAYSYDDATIARFEKDTGIRVPGAPKDLQRFAQRYAFLSSAEMRDGWIDWRCDKMHEFYLKVRDRVRAVRPDLDTFVSLYIDIPHDRAWSQSGKPVREYLREWGYKPEAYFKDDDLWFGRWVHAILHCEPARRRPGYATGWEQTVGPEFTESYQRDERRSVVIMYQWHESTYRAPGATGGRGGFSFEKPSDWPIPGNRGRTLFQPNGDNTREAFVQTLITDDPEVLMYGFLDVNMMVGQEQDLREFAQVIRALPRGKFEPVLGTGLLTNLAIRQRVEGNNTLFYVANPGYYPIRGTVTLSGAVQVADLVSGAPVATTAAGGKTTVPISLKPFAVVAFRAEGPVRVEAWDNQPLPEEQLAHMRTIMADGEQRLAATEGPLSGEDRAYLRETITTARREIAQGAYARAWGRLTNWRYWGLVREKTIHGWE